MSQNELFLQQFNYNLGWLYNRVETEANRKVFLDTCLDIIKKCEQYENLVSSRIELERAYKLCELERDGWRVYTKQMKRLAYSTALDVIYNIYKKNGCPIAFH